MQQGRPIENHSTIQLAYWESLIALRSGGVRIALTVFSLLLLMAVFLGVVRTKERQSDAKSAQQENQLVKELFDDVLGGESDPEVLENLESARFTRLAKQLRMSASSPYLVSHATNLWDVSLFPSPLSALSVGASQRWPDLYRVHGISLAKTVQRSDQIRPVSSAYGPFDVTFVVMAIAPLVVIGLTFNVSSRDRESGLQNLTVAQTRSLGKLMALRCFVRAAMVIGLVVCVINGALLIAFGNQFDLNVVINLVVWNVVATLYLLIWAAFSHFVNSFAKSSAANGAALLLLWLVIVLLIPGFVSYQVQKAIPTPPESELVDLEKSTFDGASKNAEELVERFQAEHADIEISVDDEQQMALVNYLLAHDEAGQRAAHNVLAHFSAQSLRAKYLNFCDWVSPAISFRNQSDQCSGNHERAFIDFSAHAGQVQAQVMKVFLKPSIANQQCTSETIAALPEFQESEIPKRPSFAVSIQSIASMLVWLTILVILGTRQYQKRLNQSTGAESA